jgi:hypothetical protein
MRHVCYYVYMVIRCADSGGMGSNCRVEISNGRPVIYKGGGAIHWPFLLSNDIRLCYSNVYRRPDKSEPYCESGRLIISAANSYFCRDYCAPGWHEPILMGLGECARPSCPSGYDVSQ